MPQNLANLKENKCPRCASLLKKPRAKMVACSNKKCHWIVREKMFNELIDEIK